MTSSSVCLNFSFGITRIRLSWKKFPRFNPVTLWEKRGKCFGFCWSFISQLPQLQKKRAFDLHLHDQTRKKKIWNCWGSQFFGRSSTSAGFDWQPAQRCPWSLEGLKKKQMVNNISFGSHDPPRLGEIATGPWQNSFTAHHSTARDAGAGWGLKVEKTYPRCWFAKEDIIFWSLILETGLESYKHHQVSPTHHPLLAINSSIHHPSSCFLLSISKRHVNFKKQTKTWCTFEKHTKAQQKNKTEHKVSPHQR